MSAAGAPFVLFDQIPLGICVLDRDLRVRFWNLYLEEWTGLERDEVLGTTISQRFEHLGEPPYRPRLEAVLEGGPPTIFSSQLHPHLIPAALPDGRLRIQHTVVTAIPGTGAGDGEFDALVSIQDVTDVTRRLEDSRQLRDRALREIRERERAEEERRRLETTVQQAQKLESLGVLAGGIAHDFNNLLVGILGNAELVKAELPAGSETRRMVEAVIESAQRAAELSDQMLAYSGKGRFQTIPMNLSEWVHGVLPLLRSSVSKKAILRCSLPPNLPSIEADPTQIRQVVLNLVTNASDALGEGGGLITVATGTVEADRSYFERAYLAEDLPAGEYVCLEVADSGRGMDADVLEKIFDPFFSTKFTGRGLGLAAVLGIVRGHRGALLVESEPGRGTTFRVLFPCSGTVAAETPRPEPEPPHRMSRTVLVVDDEKLVRELARSALERAGLTVLTADDGREGVEVFEAHAERISVVLLDMTMPQLSGEEVFEKVRAIRPGVKVILSSGYSEQQTAEHFSAPGGGRPGEEAGPADFIKKPYRPQDLIEKVRKVLGE